MTSAPRKCDRSEVKKLLAKLDSPSVVVRYCGIKRLPNANIPLILNGLRRAMSDRSYSIVTLDGSPQYWFRDRVKI